ncbi:Fanconi anemia group D2 protein [Bacillus rossius redtenbacheri]|uniref:Fanconi anemia group D2 protein n=1 Tax=Bacillus rossius redtenbacheri TaxID=93214 RepID=UPI002FDDB666
MYKKNFKFTPKTNRSETTRPKRTNSDNDETSNLRSFSSPSPVKRTRTAEAEALNTSNCSSFGLNDSILSRNRTSTQLSKDNYFLKVITESGYTFCNGEHNVLNVKKGAFLSNVEQNLADNPKNVARFMKGLKDYCKNVDNFKKALECPKFSVDICPDDESFHLRADGLFHMLLTLKSIQPEVVGFLMEKALQLYITRTRTKKDNIPWVYIILKQLRLMGPIVDAKALIELYFITLKDVDNSVQVDVIAMFPDIFGPEHHEECARKFQAMVRLDHGLIPALLGVLGQLEVSPELQEELNRETLKILPQIPLKYLPAVVSFLVVSLPAEELQEVVNAVRDYPNYLRLGSQSSQKDSDLENYRVLTIEALYCALLTNKPLVKVWLKILEDIVEAKFFKAMDVIVLILLCSVDNDEHVKMAQKIFKAKLKTGIITSELLGKVFQHYSKVIEQHLSSVLSLMSKFLSSTNAEIISHAVSWFRLCLESLDSASCYSVASLLLREVLEGRPSSSRACLTLLNEIAVTDVSKLDQHYNLIMMRLLPRVADHDLLEVRQMMEFICRLVYSECGHRRDLDNELSRYLQKLQSSWCSEMKLKGVLCNVIAAKSIAVDSSTSDYGPSSVINIGDDVDPLEMSGRALKAKSTIEMVTDGTLVCPKAEALLYEELATTIKLAKTADIDKSFVAWLFQTVQDDFGAYYVAELNGISLPEDYKLQYLLNEYSSPGSGICIDIASSLQKEMQPGYITSRYSVMVMCPMARLLCTLSLLESGSLVSVDALLGCEVACPDPDSDPNFPALDSSDQKRFLDCLFHTANWFVELVNGFSCQDMHQVKVCQRLGHIVALLKRLAARVLALPDYRPPDCSFYHEMAVKPAPAGKGPKPAPGSKKKSKKVKGATKQKNTLLNYSTQIATQTQAAKTKPGKELTWWSMMTLYRPFLREIDMNVILLLKKPLDIQLDSQDMGDEARLNCESLLFLLVDFAAKLEHMLPVHVKRVTFGRFGTQRDAGFVRLCGLSARKFARLAVGILDHLCTKLEQVFDSLKVLLEKCAGVHDAQPMFTAHSVQLKCCCDHLLRAMIAIFSWESFHAGGNNSLLTEALRVLAKHAGDQRSSSQAASLKKLVRESCSYLKSFEKLALDVRSASSLVKLLQTLTLFVGDDAKLKEDVASMCLGYLMQTWYSSVGMEEEGAVQNRVIATFVRTYFDNSQDTFEMVTQLIESIESEARSVKKGDPLTCMSSVNRKNFHVLFQELFRTLISSTESKLMLDTSTPREKMDVWKKVNASLKHLISILKTLLSRSNKVAFFKNCAAMVKLYIAQAVPVWEEMFRVHRAEVLEDVNGMQCFTRFLYPMCNQAKQERDSVLMSYGPDVKQSLTKLMFTMRGTLAFNSYSDTFWTGTLKNKDLAGRAVASVGSEELADEGDNDEEEGEEGDNADEDNESASEERLAEDESSDADLDADENEVSDYDARVSTEF